MLLRCLWKVLYVKSAIRVCCDLGYASLQNDDDASPVITDVTDSFAVAVSNFRYLSHLQSGRFLCCARVALDACHHSIRRNFYKIVSFIFWWKTKNNI